MTRFVYLTTCTFLAVSFAAVSLSAAEPENMPWALLSPENTEILPAYSKPFVRWWWLGSAVDEESLTWNLEQFSEAGLGGVEITPIYGVQGNEENDVSYLSQRWMELYAHTVQEAKRLGLQVDMNNGTGWPFGGPQITPEYSARKLVVDEYKAEKGKTASLALLPKDKKQRAEASLLDVIFAGESGRRSIADEAVKNSTGKEAEKVSLPDSLLWTPDEDGTIYVLYEGHTYQKVKRAAPGGEGLVMNHYSSSSLRHYLNRFEEAFTTSGAPWPDTFFNDSFEVYGSDWTPGLPEAFEDDHGYRLESMIPEFLGEGDPDISARVVTDYRETLASLLEENFTIPWTEWAHGHDVKIRNQAHGSPANIIDLYADVDIPECESFGRSDFDIPGLRQDPIIKPNDGDPAVLKFASSAAHLTGKKLVSAEALTWLTEHFRTSLSQCKPEVDLMFASGVNHLYFHGAPYSPEGADFPGWKFYAAIDMSPTNNIWHHAPAFFDYVSRCQSFLSSGKPDNDVLLYLPLYDIWYEQQERPFLIFDIHKMDKTMPRVKAAMNSIVRSGYDADYISDRFIMTLSVRDGHLISEGGTEYKALVMPECRLLPLKTMEKVTDLARQGATVIFSGRVPDDVPGWGDLEVRRKQAGKILKKFAVLAAGGESEGVKECRVGRGKFMLGDDIASMISRTDAVCEDFKKTYGGQLARLRNDEGGYDYFMSMLENRPVHGFVSLGCKDHQVWFSDPLAGGWQQGITRTDSLGRTAVWLNLEPGESVLLRTLPEHSPVAGAAESVIGDRTRPLSLKGAQYMMSGDTLVLDSGWTVSFPESLPSIDGVFETDKPVQWCSLPDSTASVNVGIGRYEAEFVVPEDGNADGWILDLGDVRESAEVCLDGERIGTAFSVPFRLFISSGKLKPGISHRLTVDVCNLPSNRIADMERRGVKWRIFKDANIASVTGARNFSFAEWTADPSGLNSVPVLVPIVFAEPEIK